MCAVVGQYVVVDDEGLGWVEGEGLLHVGDVGGSEGRAVGAVGALEGGVRGC